MKPWKRIEPTIVSKIGWRTVVTKLFKMPDGKLQHWQTLSPEGSQASATIALTGDNRVIVACQFRPGPEKIFNELPGGGVDADDEHLEAAARRELLEETGYEAGSMTFLGHITYDAYSNGIHNYFLARDCTLHPDGQKLDENEFIEVHLISIDELFENARNGNMTDVAAVFLAYEQLKKISKGE